MSYYVHKMYQLQVGFVLLMHGDQTLQKAHNNYRKHLYLTSQT